MGGRADRQLAPRGGPAGQSGEQPHATTPVEVHEQAFADEQRRLVGTMPAAVEHAVDVVDLEIDAGQGKPDPIGRPDRPPDCVAAPVRRVAARRPDRFSKRRPPDGAANATNASISYVYAYQWSSTFRGMRPFFSYRW
jgi:hypothetical protein